MAIFNQVVSGGGTPKFAKQYVNDDGFLREPDTIIDLTGITDVDDYALGFTYRGNNSISGEVDFSSLEEVSGEEAFNECFANCENITSVDLSSLSTVTGNNAFLSCFEGCFSITDIDLSNLSSADGHSCFQTCFTGNGIINLDLSNIEVIGPYAFSRTFGDCVDLETVDLSSLNWVKEQGLNSCFDNCTNLYSVDIHNIETIDYGGMEMCFCCCESLTSLSFNSLKNVYGEGIFDNMLDSVDGCEVHFPENLESTMENWAEVLDGFGGTNTTILFDLPSTEEPEGLEED